MKYDDVVVKYAEGIILSTLAVGPKVRPICRMRNDGAPPLNGPKQGSLPRVGCSKRHDHGKQSKPPLAMYVSLRYWTKYRRKCIL